MCDELKAIRAKELAEMVPVHVMRLANTNMGLSLMDWDEISNDILEAATLLSALTAANARAEAAEARVGELSEALRWYADETNYIEIASPLDLSQETRTQPPKIGADCGRRAQGALSGKPVRMTPTESADARRVQEIVPELIDQLRADASKMSPGPERVHVLAASNWLDSLLLRLATRTLKGAPDGR